MKQNTNPRAKELDEIMSSLREDHGDETMKRWKARRLIIHADHNITGADQYPLKD